MKLTTEQKKALFRQNMGIAETVDAAQNAVGRYATNHRRSAYQNMAGSHQMTHPNTRPLSITIKNTGTEVQNAILFGAHVATEQSGANIEITSRTAPSIAAINSEVASKPMILEAVIFQANTKPQIAQGWDLVSKDLFGGGTNDVFIPEMHQDPTFNSETLIKAALPKFTASGNNWIRIPIEAGNTVTINFIPGAQLSLEGITEGTNTVE